MFVETVLLLEDCPMPWAWTASARDGGKGPTLYSGSLNPPDTH
jgi:hypothetical protein